MGALFNSIHNKSIIVNNIFYFGVFDHNATKI